MNPSELKNKVEAILFSTGKKVPIDYLAKLTRSKREEILPVLEELKKEYLAKGSSLIIDSDGENWKITVHETYSPIVRKIVPQAELTKTMIETLAVIAWKAPALQSDVIKIRTNKAYDHISEIEKAGFISREKYGRTHLIKLTQRFYDYFDVHNEAEIKSKFGKFKDMAEQEAEKNERDNPASVPEVQKQDEVPGSEQKPQGQV